MPNAAHLVALHVEPAYRRLVRTRTLAALARRVLAAEGEAPAGEVSVAISSDERLRELNRRYRDVDAPTDVLSFRLDDEAGFVTPPGAARQLGEVVISYPTAERQAHEAGQPLEDELAHLLVHGLLHLLGYDHESAGEARTMRAREEALLGRSAH